MINPLVMEQRIARWRNILRWANLASNDRLILTQGEVSRYRSDVIKELASTVPRLNSEQRVLYQSWMEALTVMEDQFTAILRSRLESGIRL